MGRVFVLSGKRVVVAAVLASLVSFGMLTPSAASAASSVSVDNVISSLDELCIPAADPIVDGKEAVDRLVEYGTVDRFAASSGVSVKDFKKVVKKDDAVKVDACAKPFVVEESVSAEKRAGATQTGVVVSGSVQAPAVAADVNVFALASRSSSSRTIYLDFDGATISGTAWNSTYNSNQPIVAPGFSVDADYSTFNESERAVVYDVWSRVAQDYAPFDVNVTTAVPASSALVRSSAGDSTYGTTALITNDNVVFSQCSCGGLAYVSAFSHISASKPYSPALVFLRGLGLNSKYIAEAAAHEVGHNLGLVHDGQLSTAPGGALEYYGGHGSWAPIMGVSYYRPVTQWSSGEYAYANNLQNDFSVMAANGVTALADDHADGLDAAVVVPDQSSVAGNVSFTGDVDAFKFSASGLTTVSVSNPYGGNIYASDPYAGAAVAGNLKARLRIFNAAGSLVATVNDSVSSVNYSVASGLTPSYTFTPSTPGNFYAFVDGVGFGDPASSGFSSYGSVGAYNVSLSTNPVVVASPVVTPKLVNSAAFSGSFTASGGAGGYTFSLASGSLPAGVSLSSAGVLSGVPSSSGVFPITVRAADSGSKKAVSSTVTLVSYAPLGVSTGSSLSDVFTAAPYSVSLAASGGVGPYVFARTSGSLPVGISLSSAGVLSGSSSVAGVYSFTVSATDSLNNTVSKAFSFKVVTPVSVSSSVPAGQTGGLYSGSVSASGGFGGFSYSVVDGVLPAGVSLSSAGVFSGVPSAEGIRTVTVRAVDQYGFSSDLAVTLRIFVPVSVSVSNVLTGSVGASYSGSVSASGGGDGFKYSVGSGSLPPGVSLASNGVLSGTPSSAGSFSFTVRAVDQFGLVGVRSVTISVVSLLKVVSTAVPAGAYGEYYSYILSASGGSGSYSWSLNFGSLPAGVSLSSAGVLFGTPSSSGTFSFTVGLSDGSSSVVSSLLSVYVAPPVVVSPPPPPPVNPPMPPSYTPPKPVASVSVSKVKKGSKTLNFTLWQSGSVVVVKQSGMKNIKVSYSSAGGKKVSLRAAMSSSRKVTVVVSASGYRSSASVVVGMKK